MNEVQRAAAKQSSVGYAGVAVVAFAAVMVGLSFVMARLTYDAGSNPLTVIALRYPVVALLLWALIALRGGSVVLARRELLTSYGVGLAYFIGAGGYLASIVYLPVSLAALLFYSYPLMAVVWQSLLDRRPPRALHVVAFLVAFGGLALALEVSVGDLDPRGVVLVLIGALGISCAFVWTGRSLAAVDVTVVTLHISICGSVVAAVAILGVGSFTLPAAGLFGWSVLAATILCFAAGFVAMFAGIKMIGALRTSMVFNLEPVATIALAVLILGEVLTLQQVIGAVLVIGAIVVTQRPTRSPIVT